MCVNYILSCCLEVAEDYKISKETVRRIKNDEEKTTFTQNIKNYEVYLSALAYPMYAKYAISAIRVISGMCF